MVGPTVVFKVAIAVNGPGCGGTMPCMAARAEITGTPTYTYADPLKRCWPSSLRATLKISGSITTRPTSKNMGMPMTNATSVMAQGIIRGEV
ncbi:hypothetical protein G6F35_018284 [Rhizopus arrhizus]|nr:hypothetical protein G6F35_018284 [Rhizopus arrhizus]